MSSTTTTTTSTTTTTLTGTTTHPRVLSVSKSPTHTISKTPVPSITLLPNHGVSGDCHAGKTTQHTTSSATSSNLRQIHLLPIESLRHISSTPSFKGTKPLTPGGIGENVTTEGIELGNLPPGCPYASNASSVQLRSGNGGLLLMQDTQLIETLSHFARERIPERVVHAKAAGYISSPLPLPTTKTLLTAQHSAYGEFTCTHDCSDITSASFLSEIGKTTQLLLRVSTVGPEAGSADTLRDVHGWAMKLYTDEGNLDWVFNNTPVFFIRDPLKFPSLNRSHKRNPQSHLPDPNMFWDFHAGNPEGFHQLLHLFSDRGTPASLRHINAYSGHTYKFTLKDGSFKYVKFHIKTTQGIKNLTKEESVRMAGENPDFLIQDLFEAIERKDYPTWNVYVQVMSPEQAENYRWNIFDMTKVWPHSDFPLRQIGTMKLNRNPRNYFTDIEQAAFSPSNMVPGVAPSADPMLQARMFSYPDAARYRVGTNYQQLPTNAAKTQVYCPYQRDGQMNFSDNYGADPNYVGSSLKPIKFYQDVKGQAPQAVSTLTEHEKWVGQVSNFQYGLYEDDFVQARGLWKVIGKEEGHQERFFGNVAVHLGQVWSDKLRARVYELFSMVDPGLGEGVKKATEEVLGV
ncbi:catalase [Aspergillus niger]|uniref:Catalase n=1 Tax=Aspergillus niger TaxID=5061 RepID=A0A100IU49_ASPNG|nr:catalase [Aspergillus niger]